MNTDCVYKKTFFLPFFAPGISRTIMTQRKIFFSSSKPNKAFFDKNLDSKDVVYDVIIPSIFPQKGWKVIFNLKILKKTNLTLLLLHIVSNDIKTKETNYYSQCLFFFMKFNLFHSFLLTTMKGVPVCLSVCLTSNGFIIGSIFSVFTKVRHCQKLISKFRVSNTWTNTRFFSICWISEWA